MNRKIDPGLQREVKYQRNMTREGAARAGITIGARVRHSTENYAGKKKTVKTRDGVVIGIWKHGFVVQLAHYKTFFRYNLLRGQEIGEKVEILFSGKKAEGQR